MVLAGDNGAENLLIARGSAGVFEGSYFTSSEGGLRTPCLIRWPGEIASERASNELVHQTDMFTTLLAWAACPIPDDREIDGVDQRTFFSGSQEDLEPRGVPRLGHRPAPRRQMAELQSRIRATPLHGTRRPRSWPRQ